MQTIPSAGLSRRTTALEDGIERWAQNFRPRFSRFAFRAFPRLAASALAMQAAGLASPVIPALFSQHLRVIPPALNEDLLDLYGRSEQVTANRFAFFNHAETLEPDFDWESPASSAWRRELHAFDYALDLAMTYRISQESRYAHHLRYLIAHWIACNPPGRSCGWEPQPLARRIRNWILAADLARQQWSAETGFLDLLSRSLALQCVFLIHNATAPASPGAAARAARALLLASRYFAGARGADFGERGTVILRAAAQAAGRGANASCLRPAELFEVAEACVENLLLPPPAEDSQREEDLRETRRLLAALEGALLPNGTLPLFGPAARSCADGISHLFAAAAVLWKEPRWKNLAGQFGILPYLALGEPGRVAFEGAPDEPWLSTTRATPEFRLYRLSAGRGSTLVVTACVDPSPTVHQDCLSYELNLDGHRLVVDSGVYSPAEETPIEYFAGANAHNLLLVCGETPHPRGAARHASQDADWILGEGCRGLCLRDYSWNLTGSQHHRAFYALEEHAFAVVDLVEGTGTCRLMNLIHFYPAFQIEIRDDRALIRSRAMRVTLIPLGPSPHSTPSRVTLQSGRGALSSLPGLYSPEIGVKFDAGVLALGAAPARLPWQGGYLLIAGDEIDFRLGRADPRKGVIEFELAGKRYRLMAR